MRAQCQFYWLLLFILSAATAEIIDRIAVVVGNSAITESEILQEIRMAAFENGEKPNFGPQQKRAAADRLVEQRLIRKEMELSHYAMPQPSEVEPTLAQLRKGRFSSEAQYRQELEKYGITEEDLKSYLLWQLTILRFIEERFSMKIQVQEPDARQYFEQTLRPELRKSQREQSFSFDDFRDQAERNLTAARVDKELEVWLNSTRKRTQIEYREEVFK